MDTSRLKMLANELKQKHELEQSMRLASKRQLRMLPSMPKVEGYEFKSLYVPCSNVSGDFYDFIRVSEFEIGIALGDVSGHGIEAGIIMGMAKKALQIYAKGVSSPKQALATTNLDLAGDLGESTFVSAAYGILNTRDRVFRFARAGNNPPYLINPGRDPVVREVKPNGMVIGVDKTGKRFPLVLQEEVIELRPGDVFFQFTDGIVEAPDRDKREFEEERLRALLNRTAGASLDEVVGIVEEALNSHIGNLEQEDDITMVAFRVL
ncbi:MAG TPA: PP2C family protein-serine/threonine phosphatase [Planctomycetota bacterium]|nr:PP2C family protein-serine/threonine phosphatase [Planctomycetota bacterium]